MHGGAHILTDILGGIDRSQVMVCFVSRRSGSSQWFEVGRALDEIKDRVIPVRLDRSPLPWFLEQIQYIDWFPDAEAAYAELLEACRGIAVSGRTSKTSAHSLPLRDILGLCNRAAVSLYKQYVRHVEDLRIDCTFDLAAEPGEESRVAGMSIQGALLTSNGENWIERFRERGAVAQRSRYRSPFGKLFFARQQQMLGSGLDRTENRYLAEIAAALRSPNGDRKQLIDLMAGGGNRRLIELLQSDPRLFVLAIETYRDCYQLVARRFNESGYNLACHRLEESNEEIHPRDVAFYREVLEGTDRFRLFCEVVEHHLWDAGAARPTSLGAALNATSKPLDLQALHPNLRTESIGLSYAAVSPSTSPFTCWPSRSARPDQRRRSRSPW